ncbi:DUF1176 domain-containing protein [Pseudovibrio brasiliensis]|uniref:DUF1176 domain-containing protein n=1 Tax=Pseudovibrio brasiliensis TaxID=1898042 RepID=A0ABX8AIW9_9HYPH|nr:DUF1176 domain-containing protein [Pseudovibrio brasiliensis]QUS55019.1 DUF1176 domain-containing protein [Pseudovibrio brasiliensis]
MSKTLSSRLAAALFSTAAFISPLKAEPIEPIRETDPKILNRYLKLLDQAYPCDWKQAHEVLGNFRLKFGKNIEVLDFACSISPYNEAHVFVRVDTHQPDKAKLLSFKHPANEGNDDPEVVFNAVWDIKTGDLTSFMKGRGLGDCGTYEVHRFTSEGYPHLLEFRAKPECDGNYVQPEKYPVVFTQPQ